MIEMWFAAISMSLAMAVFWPSKWLAIVPIATLIVLQFGEWTKGKLFG
jgi:hypothetical protein